MKTLIFAGSTRNDSVNRKLAQEIHSAITGSTLLELRDYPMPLYDGDLEARAGLPEPVRRFKQMLRDHDTVVIASPEYNGFFPAHLKNVIDWATRPELGESHSVAFRGKHVILVSASPGPGGGRRGLVQLTEQLETIGAKVLKTFAIPKALSADLRLTAAEVAEALAAEEQAA